MSSIFALLTEEQHQLLIEDLARFERQCRAEAARRASLPAEPRVPGETVYATTGPHTQEAVWVTVIPGGLARMDSNSSLSSAATFDSAFSFSNTTSLSRRGSSSAPQERAPTPPPSRELTPEERYARGLARFHQLEKELRRKQARREHALAVQRARLPSGGLVASWPRAPILTRKRSSSQSTFPVKPWY
ncbi:hypothetical protein AURDEDRAFT_161212 [Auricularia subglabra TFB-10046 SS5]|nr:hypothetical protein AURDEDRAFT_161212 [Auricularia subglabra TFB-10046 SS5]